METKKLEEMNKIKKEIEKNTEAKFYNLNNTYLTPNEKIDVEVGFNFRVMQ